MPTSLQRFKRGLVFGFDVGSNSIGWAVRRGAEFLDVGVLICAEESTTLEERRTLRRQRRTLRSKKYRRQWLARELKKLGLPPPPSPCNRPVELRKRALDGESLAPHELHSAIAHLWRRRGYREDVPWSARKREAPSSIEEDKEEKAEKEQIKAHMAALRKDMQAAGCTHPCEFLLAHPHSQRRRIWPRDLLEKEFRAIVAAQRRVYPKLAEQAEWLLYGDTRDNKHNVFFKATEGRNPGVLGLRWPRFDNRKPALDSLRPVDEQGRPQHVIRKDKAAYQKAQWEMALVNFRVIECATGKIKAPSGEELELLRELHAKSKREPRKTATPDSDDPTPDLKIGLSLLKRWLKELDGRYRLVEGQQPLTPQSGAGRARYSTPTLRWIGEQLAEGRRVDPPHPLLRRPNETPDAALNRYLAEIRHPLVRHRLLLFRRLLAEMVSKYGQPDLLVLEAVRSLALSEKNRRKLLLQNKKNFDERTAIRETLEKDGRSTSRRALLRYRLWKEAGCICPFCLQTISQEDLYSGGADIEHIVPRAIVDCDEYYNLTVGHTRCNREIKGDRTPFQAFANTDLWESISRHVRDRFSQVRVNQDYTKADLFLHPNAESLVEQKADLQHTAYIARIIRHVALLQLGWLGEDGRDPTPLKQNPALRFQVTNGQLTSRLRRAWGLNQVLHPLPAGQRWDTLAPEEQDILKEKNRGDLRHHALDAIVIACTLPWLAHRTHGATDEEGNHGWWTQDEKKRSTAANPVLPEPGALRRTVENLLPDIEVRHHRSRSKHAKTYLTTLYGKLDANRYAAREELKGLKPTDLTALHPPELAEYCRLAWENYRQNCGDIEEQLKTTRGCLPEAFINRLCFAHFQRWREQWKRDPNTAFTWPATVKVPIRRVKCVGVHDDSSVFLANRPVRGYIKRHGYREAQIRVSTDGKQLVPVLIPYWKDDPPVAAKPFQIDVRPVARLRINDIVELKTSPGEGKPAGRYRVDSTQQRKIKLWPVHLARSDEALKAAGYKPDGVRLAWQQFFKHAGYELPHRPSAPAGSAGAAAP